MYSWAAGLFLYQTFDAIDGCVLLFLGCNEGLTVDVVGRLGQ
jgi:hypothetical protein